MIFGDYADDETARLRAPVDGDPLERRRATV
jgi:hypothetical protein